MKLQIAATLATIAIIFSIFHTGCEKGPLNGNLDNMWKITSMERNGETTHPHQYYYHIYRDVIQLTAPGKDIQTGVLEYKSGILYLTFPISKAEDLAPWGIDGKNQEFKVKLSSNNLTLTSGTTIIKFKKF
ncbi:lipocalin-like domain-containing protein [uncultured Muribaculum sp.]|uniref:lipocalin-like domain-containing protein n=1 Tax=uncultured Muribaculum sp. TaxID=1918613 RepID=UPI0025B743B0|nr:lipocalin-like domain-containing protein [uncultured Muribaculum sp.]